MAAANPASGGPVVSVIVPARNEEVSLGACLESLVAQGGVAREIIVVDDGSTDRTREIAQSFPEVRVISAPPLPAGWTGKNNAMAAGAREARGEWLLFTDADTVHLPSSLACSVEEARYRHVSLLSFSPEQEFGGFWERVVMVVIFAELASTYRPSQVSDPNCPAAAANGQYLMISREAYDGVGGHEAVAGSLLEDVAIARIVKSSGRAMYFRYGRDLVRTRMYRSFAQLREGWTKNLALLFPSPLRLASLRLLEFMLYFTGLITAAIFWNKRWELGGVIFLLCSVVALASFWIRIQRAHFPARANRFALLGLPVFAYLLLRSRLSHKHGKVQWKGRTYEGSKQEHVVTAASAVHRA